MVRGIDCRLRVPRLEGFESQEALAQMIVAAGNGLAGLRKNMRLVEETAPDARDQVESILVQAKAYVEAYVKHSTTAASLSLACMFAVAHVSVACGL